MQLIISGRFEKIQTILRHTCSKEQSTVVKSGARYWQTRSLVRVASLKHARVLKVFKTLFYSPSVTSTPGEVARKDFLYAMLSIGFVPGKLYGSVWQFSPDLDKLAVERSVQFHEPHNVNTKILYCIARRHGRRLNRAYGWDGSSFTLEEKLKQ